MMMDDDEKKEAIHTSTICPYSEKACCRKEGRKEGKMVSDGTKAIQTAQGWKHGEREMTYPEKTILVSVPVQVSDVNLSSHFE